jgi:hypothetical protein
MKFVGSAGTRVNECKKETGGVDISEMSLSDCQGDEEQER